MHYSESKSILQLTDDAIESFVMNLADYLERHPLTIEEINGDGYDHLKDFVFKELENYSNGYVNYN